MRKIRKISFEELVAENKQILLKDKKAMEKINQKVESRRTK